MNDSIWVALIAAFASILVASLTFYFTKKHEREADLRNEKLNHYKVLFSAMSDLVVAGANKNDAAMRFSLAVNTIALAAPQNVINALMSFHNEASSSSRNIERHNELLKELLLAVRKDIGLAKGDDRDTFNFHLIGAAPISKQAQD
ncbi:MAG: hypothetical protein HY938_05875 [Nitrosomonadales bacterium]|nr:hypothetical protein [Nitrosomonadales bacterium]